MQPAERQQPDLGSQVKDKVDLYLCGGKIRSTRRLLNFDWGSSIILAMFWTKFPFEF